MTQWNLGSKRKSTGGLRHRMSKKKRMQRGRDFIPTLLGSTKRLAVRTRGGNVKYALRREMWMNVSDGTSTRRVRVLNVLENTANPHWVRRNIITKGVIVETDAGKAIVTSRPNQHGILNGKLISE